MAVVNGYTFYCSNTSKLTKSWRCTKGRVCKARLITTNDVTPSRRIMLSARLEHAHPPPAFLVSDGYCKDYKFEYIPSTGGNPLILYDGYTYSRHRTTKSNLQWQCSSQRTSKCKARLIMHNSGYIVKVCNDHNHPKIPRIES